MKKTMIYSLLRAITSWGKNPKQSQQHGWHVKNEKTHGCLDGNKLID